MPQPPALITPRDTLRRPSPAALVLAALCGLPAAWARQDTPVPTPPDPTPPVSPAPVSPPPASAPPAEAAADQTPIDSDSLLAWEDGRYCDLATHRVLFLLRSIEAPTIEQYRAAALGLRVARRYRPEDAEVLRAEIEAWDAAQDTEAALAGVRELVRLDPSDTVALLRVAAARITNLQDADQRLKAYEGLINSKGIDAAVRSRLALDAALLARETGDERGFLDRLLLSTSLDVTNKEAAALTVTTYLDKSTDPVERFDLLSSVILADPHDPEPYRNLSFELRRRLAFKASARFLELARTLNSYEGRSPTAAQQLEYFQSIWDSLGPEKCLEQIERLVDMEVVAERLRRKQLEDSGRDPGPQRDIRLPPSLERVRLMVHVARMDDSGSENSVRSLEGSHNEALTSLATNPPEAPPGQELPVEQRGEAVRRSLLTDFVWVRLFSGTRLDTVEADIEELSKPGAEGSPELSPEALNRFRGWLHVVRGELAEGRALLEPLAATDGSALWALGVACQREGETDKAAGYFERLAREYSSTALGSAGRQRWERLKGVPFETGPVAATLNGHGLRFAPWLEDTIKDARRYISVEVSSPKPVLHPLDLRADARVVLTNVSRQPMGLGVGRSINPRILLGVQLVMGGRAVSAEVRPEVLNLARRLRLMPGESIDVTVWGGRGDLARLFDLRPTQGAQIRWTATQGFVFSEGSLRPGATSVRAQSPMFSRNPLRATLKQENQGRPRQRGDAPPPPAPPITTEAIASSVLNDTGPASFHALALACYRVGPSRRDSDIDPVTEGDARTLAAALTERFGRADAREVAFMIPRLEVVGAFADAPLRAAAMDAVQRVNHPVAWMLGLLTIPEAATTPEFVASAKEASSGDADLSALVGLIDAHFNPTKSAVPKPPEEGVQVVPVGAEPPGPQGGQGP